MYNNYGGQQQNFAYQTLLQAAKELAAKESKALENQFVWQPGIGLGDMNMDMITQTFEQPDFTGGGGGLAIPSPTYNINVGSGAGVGGGSVGSGITDTPMPIQAPPSQAPSGGGGSGGGGGGVSVTPTNANNHNIPGYNSILSGGNPTGSGLWNPTVSPLGPYGMG